MATETDIATAALLKVGEYSILDIDDDSKPAKICKRRLPQLRDKLLRTYPWSFAIARLELSLSVDTPAYEYDYAHSIPTDCLRVIEIDLTHTEFRREGQYILSNNSSVYMKYIKKVIDPMQMDSAFIEALSALLAREICMVLADNQSLYKILDKDYAIAISEARNASAIEHSGEVILSENWLLSRFTGSAGPEGFYRGS